MAEEESKLIDAVFTALAYNGKLTLHELFGYSYAVRQLSGDKQELEHFLWIHSHFFRFDYDEQRYSNQDRQRYTPFVRSLLIHLQYCENCSIRCLLDFLAESENDDQLEIAAHRQYYCGYDTDGLLIFLQDHEGLFVIDESADLTIDRAVQLNPQALDYESIRFADCDQTHNLPSSNAIRDNSCIAYGIAEITAVYSTHRSFTLQFISTQWAGDQIYCSMTLLPCEPKEGMIIEVEAVRMYNAANVWRAVSMTEVKNQRDADSSLEEQFFAVFHLLRTQSYCKTADALFNEIKSENLFANPCDLWAFVKNNPHLFRTREDLISLRSKKHIEAFTKILNALGPGSFPLSSLGDALDDESDFWKCAYGLDWRRRVLGFYYDHTELFEVLIEFPDQLNNEVKWIGNPFVETLAQLEDKKPAQKILISPISSYTSLIERQLLSAADFESQPNEDRTEIEPVADSGSVNDAPAESEYQLSSSPRPEMNDSFSDRCEVKDNDDDSGESPQPMQLTQNVSTFAALSELEKHAVELIDSHLQEEECVEIGALYEKLNKLRPFTSIDLFKEFLAIRQHLYVLDEHDNVTRLDSMHRSRLNLLLRLSQTQCSISEIYEQLGEENQSQDLLAELRQYDHLFEITEVFQGDHYVKAKGGYNIENETFVPSIYENIRIKSVKAEYEEESRQKISKVGGEEEQTGQADGESETVFTAEETKSVVESEISAEPMQTFTLL
uniref:Uncharacterized protein n=1 Tax=Plectus sambesii TaxID=2011161 RepID=A0A914VCU6_9BILA